MEAEQQALCVCRNYPKQPGSEFCSDTCELEAEVALAERAEERFLADLD